MTEGIHGNASDEVDVLSAVDVEDEALARERDLLARDPGRCEALEHVALDAPGHRADEALGRRR